MLETVVETVAVEVAGITCAELVNAVVETDADIVVLHVAVHAVGSMTELADDDVRAEMVVAVGRRVVVDVVDVAASRCRAADLFVSDSSGCSDRAGHIGCSACRRLGMSRVACVATHRLGRSLSIGPCARVVGTVRLVVVVVGCTRSVVVVDA